MPSDCRSHVACLVACAAAVLTATAVIIAAAAISHGNAADTAVVAALHIDFSRHPDSGTMLWSQSITHVSYHAAVPR